MFTRRISKQTKLMMLFVIVPLYLYCGSLIASAIIKFILLNFSILIDENTITTYLNFGLDLGFVLIGFAIMKDDLIEQWKDFFKELKDNLVYGCLIGTALIYGAGFVGGIISLIFGMPSQSQNQQLVETLAMAHPLMMIATSVILAPVFEEIFFRGMIFTWAYELHPKFAHVLSAFLFGFVHVMNAVLSGNAVEMLQIFAYVFMGGALSYLYEKRNNIFVPILSHSLNNFISLILMFFH